MPPQTSVRAARVVLWIWRFPLREDAKNPTSSSFDVVRYPSSPVESTDVSTFAAAHASFFDARVATNGCMLPVPVLREKYIVSSSADRRPPVSYALVFTGSAVRAPKGFAGSQARAAGLVGVC